MIVVKLPTRVQPETKEKDNPETPDALAKKRTMRLSIVEGSFAQVAQSTNDNYIAPYGLKLNANAAEYGVLQSISAVLSPLGYIWEPTS